ncbi:MAG: aldehyde dehydrogenase family protein, partial [Myxococcales bacterium]|nr:aldehyde dehydrogenase family protein [Myxococcales bacterium]
MNTERHGQFYIDGDWVKPASDRRAKVINPATEQEIATIAMADAADVDRAVAAARRAFASYSQTSVDERLALLDRVIAAYQARMPEIAATLSQEMGAPIGLATELQAPCGLGVFASTRATLAAYAFEQEHGNHVVVREPIGVCGLITPWNWPLMIIAGKVATALAAGCTVVLKPSENAPLSALLLAEIMAEAGVPPGVFNLINGDGPTAGVAMSSHPDIDMISFTGSTRAGVSIAQQAAPSIKRVAQELGGKSPNVLLDDADFAAAIARDAGMLCWNSGQSCNAPTRMLVPRDRMDEAAAIAKATFESVVVGDPSDPKTQVGPVVSEAAFKRVQDYIRSGIEAGATLASGGLGRPEGIERGYFVRPTVFANVDNSMRIAQEEIFGPVIDSMTFRTPGEALALANNSRYGLAASVWS